MRKNTSQQRRTQNVPGWQLTAVVKVVLQSPDFHGAAHKKNINVLTTEVA